MRIFFLFYILVLAVCFLGAARLLKKTKALPRADYFKALVIPISVFLLYEHLAIGNFWDFNPLFVSGFRVFNVPIEQIAFFCTASVGFLFLWEVIRSIVHGKTLAPKYFFAFAASAVMSLAFLKPRWTYSYTASFLFLIALVLDLYIFRTNTVNTKAFFIALGAAVLLVFVFNCYLALHPVIFYSPVYKSGIGILNMPVENFIYFASFFYFCAVFREKSLHIAALK